MLCGPVYPCHELCSSSIGAYVRKKNAALPSSSSHLCSGLCIGFNHQRQVSNLRFFCSAVGDASWAVGMVGKVDVQELDWSRPEQYALFSPPYDYILAADCVYSELAGALAMLRWACVPQSIHTIISSCCCCRCCCARGLGVRCGCHATMALRVLNLRCPLFRAGAILMSSPYPCSMPLCCPLLPPPCCLLQSPAFWPPCCT